MSAAQSAGNLCAVFLIGLLVGKLRKSTVLAIAAVATPCVFFLLGIQPVFAAALGAFFVYGICLLYTSPACYLDICSIYSLINCCPSAPPGWLRAKFCFVKPVSYTHLDVYKRQS